MPNTKHQQDLSSKTVKILDVGSGPYNRAAKDFNWIENKEITRLDFNEEAKPDILHDITKPLPEELRNQFDIVYASHVLEHIDFMKVIATFRNLTGALKNMGEIWVVVPSMEWAASEIINKREGIQIQGTIFGGQNHPLDYHRSGFTLRSLRHMVELCGLFPRKAYQSTFGIDFQNQQYECVENVVIGLRIDLEDQTINQ